MQAAPPPEHQQHHAHHHHLHGAPPPPSFSASSSATAPVRLPPVSLPPADFLEAPSFNPGRRQSVNSDPVLHAFSAAAAPSDPVPSSSSAPAPPLAAPARDPYGAHPPPPHQARRVGSSGDSSMEVLRAGSPGEHHLGAGGPAGGMHDGRFPPPPGSSGAHDGYEYGAPQYAQPHLSQSYNPSSVGPAASYRFGGPSNAQNGPLDAPSYFDYSMRRHSISKNLNGNGSPERLPPPPPPPPLHHPHQGHHHHHQQQQHRHHDSPTPSLKRKTSDDTATTEEGYGSYPTDSAYPNGPAPPAGSAPHPKRRTSSLTYERLNNLSLAEQQRRDSSYGPLSPWEEDRRGSNESYASQGSHGYPVPAYQQMNPGMQPYDQRGTPQPPMSAPHAMPPGPAWDGQQVGPRGSIARGMYDAELSQFSRRPSIPSVSQMMQGQQPFYPSGGAPQPVPSPHPHAPPPYPPHSRNLLAQPSSMAPSNPHTPAPEMDDPHTRPPTTGSYALTPHPSGPPPGPTTPWALGGPPVPPPGMHVTRHNSSGSINLDPSSAYGPGQGPPGKETPYSRSPELRVSHKLAERKRRKEMAQLFEDLRDQLPFDRGLKASKWEILSKAVEYVASLKTYTNDLANDNRALREHFNLPPGPPAQPPQPTGSPDGLSRGVLESSHSSSHAGTSHEASPAPAGMNGGAAASPFPPPVSGGPLPTNSYQNTAAVPAGHQGSMGPPQWQQQHPPSRPASQASHIGHPSPAPAPLKLQQVPGVVAGGMPPQPSPPLSQHSGTMSPMGQAHSPVVGVSGLNGTATGGGAENGAVAPQAEQ